MSGSVHIWNAHNGQFFPPYGGHTQGIKALAWSSDEYCIASISDDGALHLWNPSTRRCEYQGMSSVQKITALVWSPDGQYLGIGSQDGSVHILSRTKKKFVGISERHDGPVVALTWTPDSLTMRSLSQGKIVAWDSSRGKAIVSELHLPTQFSRAASIAFSHDEHFFASSHVSGAVTVWDRRTGLQPLEFGDHLQDVNLLTWSPDSRYLATAGRGSVQIWSTFTRSVVLHHHLHEGAIHALAWSPDSTYLASAGDDRAVRVLRIS